MTYEIQTVTRYRFLGSTYDTLKDAEIAKAYDTMTSQLGSYPWDTVRDDPRRVIAVVSAYADEIDRINDKVALPKICAANFVQPIVSNRWPTQARHPSSIYDWFAMCMEIDRLWSDSNKIAAIRMLRRCFGPIEPNLRDAKNWCEARYASN